MANGDFVDPNQQPPPLFGGNNLLGTAQGMFGGLGRGLRRGSNALHPYSNRLLLAGMGMLGGGPKDAMKGLVAGSALDTEDADRTKLNKAIQALQDDPNSTLFAGMSQPEIDIITGDKDTLGAFVSNRTRPADMPGSWDEYVLTTDNPTKAGFTAFLKSRPSGTNINLSQIPAEMGARIGLGDQFLDELDVSMAGGPSIRERIKTVFGGENATVARGQLAAGMGEPAAIWRRVESGKEALVRQLTGAGMAVPEAQAQAARYSISALDSVDTMISKMDGLARDLAATRAGALGARRGTLGEEGQETGQGNLTRNDDGTLTWSP